METPAGTIGHTMASGPTVKSTTTGRSLIALACLMMSSTSAAVSARRPTQPRASASFTKSGMRGEASEWCVDRFVCE